MADPDDAGARPYSPCPGCAARAHRLGGARFRLVILERSIGRERDPARRTDGLAPAAKIFRRGRYRLEQVGFEDFPRFVEPRSRYGVQRKPRWRKAPSQGA